MRENLTRAEIGGPLSVEFYAPLLSDDKAKELCGRVEAIEGVQLVKRVDETARGRRDTYKAMLALDVIDLAPSIYYRIIQVVDIYLETDAV